jgi:hypothetical protein
MIDKTWEDNSSAAKEALSGMTETLNYRRERLRRGWLDLYHDAEVGAGASPGIRTPANPTGRGTRTRRKTMISPATIRIRLTPTSSSNGGEDTSAPDAVRPAG